MGNWIDFRELRAKLNFAEILERYNVRLARKGKQATGPCPLPAHGGDRKKQSFSANLEKGIFQCFSCGAKGNVLDFACLMDGGNPKDGGDLRKSALRLSEGGTPPKIGAAPKPSQIIVNAPLDFELKDLDPEHEHLRQKRKLSPETIKLFGLGFCSRGYFKDRAVIPLHNLDGAHIGYAGRLVDDALVSNNNPKYLFPGKRSHKGIDHEFQKSVFLYNANRLKRPVEWLIVVEGFPSVWWLTQNGFPNCVALMGSSMSEEQKNILPLLISIHGKITLLLDGDEAGRGCTIKMEAALNSSARVEIAHLTDGEQPTDLGQSELVELLSPENIPAGIGGGVSPRHDICVLLNSFPCLASFRLTPETWDAEHFDAQALKFSSGEVSIAQFVLGVWNPRAAWQCGKFDFIEAAARLDDEHRQVIIDWFNEPWWP
jgi:DNA primase